MKVEANLVTKYKLVLRNKDTYMGSYAAGDDWDVTIYADTEEELIQETAQRLVESGICAEYASLTAEGVLVFEGQVFDVGDATECGHEKSWKIIDEAKKTALYARLMSEKEAARQRQKEEKQAREAIEAKEKRRLRYEELKKEFEVKA